MNIEKAISYCNDKSENSTNSLDQIEFKQIVNYLKELQEYHLLAEKKQLFKLPCAIGDILYYINGSFILECIVSDFWIDETGVWNIITNVYHDNETYEFQINPDTFGINLFLTKEAALNAQKI